MIFDLGGAQNRTQPFRRKVILSGWVAPGGSPLLTPGDSYRAGVLKSKKLKSAFHFRLPVPVQTVDAESWYS
jgi:hypothetical protein